MKITHSMPTLGKEESIGLAAVLATGQIATGEEVEKFEQSMASYMGLRGAVATASGTTALHLGLLALGVKEGDEVICPSYTCSALLNAIYHCRGIPRIVDIDDESLNISLVAARKAITKKTAAIIVPHMFGNPVEDIDGFLSLGPPIIEDCAQALGASYHNKMAGTWGEAAILSFYATKVITTGHGGMVVSNNESLLELVRDLRSYDKKHDYKVRYNFCMTDLQGRMGQIQLSKLSTFLKLRKERAQLYDKQLGELGCISLPTSKSIYYRYVVRINQKKFNVTLDALHRGGIDAQPPVFRPLHQYLGLEGFAVTDKVFSEAISLPIYPCLKSDDVRSIARCLRAALEEDYG